MPRSVIGIIQDVTDREAQKTALRESEDLFRSIPAASADIIRMIRDAAARAADLTRRLLGFTRRGDAARSTADVMEIVTQVFEMRDASLDARIEVSDTGTGIAPVLIDRIFEPFFTTEAP